MIDFDRNNTPVLGVAFSEERINIVELQYINDKLMITYAEESIQNNSSGSDSAHWRRQFINNLHGKFGQNKNRIIKYCVPHRLILSKIIKVEPSLLKDIPDWRQWAISKYLPETEEKFVYDFHLINNKSNVHEYLALVAPVALVKLTQHDKETLTSDGVPLIDSVANFYSIHRNGGLKNKGFTIIVNFDTRFASFAFARDEEFLDAGSFQAAADFNNEFALDELTSELITAINFRFKNYYHKDRCSMIFCGDMINEKYLIGTFSERISSRISYAQPFDDIEFSGNIANIQSILDNQNNYTAAIGTAISVFNRNTIPISTI